MSAAGPAGDDGPAARANARRDPGAYAPVIVLAAARSYSSVVVAAIGAHPQLYGFPELTLFAHETVGDALDAAPRLATMLGPGAAFDPAPGLRRAVAQVLIGGQGPEELRAAQDHLVACRDRSGAELLDELLGGIAPLVAVEKSPETTHETENMARARAWFPRARFLHLVRHPVAFQRSLQAYLFLYDHPEVCARSWLNTNRRIDDFSRRLPPDQVMVIRAEQVLAGDRADLARLARFAGVSDDAGALEAMSHPERSPYVGMKDAVALGGLDAGFLANPVLRSTPAPATLEPPEAWRLPAALVEEVGDLARGYGYVSG